jgi:hypothetical protein
MSSFRFDTRLAIAYRLGAPRLALAAGALAMAGGALAGGCSSGPSADYSTQQGFCQAMATADCTDAAVRACYGANDSSVAADTQLCIAARSTPERCNPNSLPYNSMYAQDCVDAHSNLYASDMLDPMLYQAMVQACDGVFNRGGMAGRTCTDDSDCAVIPSIEQMPGFSCIVHQGKGTCQIPNPVNSGDRCDAPAAQCPDGYSCQAGGSGVFCLGNPGKGQACGPGIPCGNSTTPLRCDAMTMQCADQLGDMSPCTAASDCAGGFCIATANGGLCSHTFTLAFGSATCSGFTAK